MFDSLVQVNKELIENARKIKNIIVDYANETKGRDMIKHSLNCQDNDKNVNLVLSQKLQGTK